MENASGATEIENSKEEHSSFCSSCKSILRSSSSVGSASLEPYWKEENVNTKTEETVQNVQTDVVDEPVVGTNANSTTSVVKRKSTVVENVNTLVLRDRKNEKEKKVGRSTDKEQTMKAAANRRPKIISNEPLSATFKVCRDDKIFRIYRNLKKNVRRSPATPKPSTSDIAISSENLFPTEIQNRILSRRKRIIEISKSLLDLCDCMNIVRKIIPRGIRKE